MSSEEEQQQVSSTKQEMMLERSVASLLLAAAGDALGYKNGEFEFNGNTLGIHKTVEGLGGLQNINVRNWYVSDDTVMHLATLRAIVGAYSEMEAMNALPLPEAIHKLMTIMAKEYIVCFRDMGGRAPGATCGAGVAQLKRAGVENWTCIKYSPYGGGCGGSMRSMCLGLIYYGEKQRDMLVASSIEAGRLTHNHPTGFLGSMVSAAFTAFAIEGIPINQWGYYLLNDLIPRSKDYCKQTRRDWENIEEDMGAFIKQFTRYLTDRNIMELNNNGPVFPAKYGPEERDEYYKSYSFRGWAGASGDDSVIIAYDSLLASGDNWDECIHRSAFHAGDSDSTGTIAAAWFGALYGLNNVPVKNYEQVEKGIELRKLGQQLYEISQKLSH